MNNNIKINISKSLNKYNKYLNKILLDRINNYKDLFKINDYRAITVNIFDNRNEFRQFIKNNFNDDIPEFSCGTYHGGMVNCFIENNLVEGSDRFFGNMYLPCHELFHLMYNEIILKDDISKRIVWYDEGMAQNLSGELDYIDDDRFKRIYLGIKDDTKIIPNLNSINFDDNSFITELYNGYDLSMLAIKYLKETLSDKDFKELLYDFERIKEFGNTILNDMFNYFDNKYLINNRH